MITTPIYAKNDVSITLTRNIGGEIIELTELNKGQIDLTVNITNESGTYMEPVGILAEFYKDDLVKVEIKQTELSGLSGKIELSMDIEENGENYKLVAYAWDMNNMEPLCDTKTLNGSKYNIPISAEVINDVLLNTATEAHPRIWVKGRTGIDELKARISGSEELTKWNNSVIADAESILGTSVCSYEDNDWRRILSSGTVLSNLTTLSYAYRITDDNRYLTRAIEEIDNVTSWEEWNVNVEALDTSAICTGLSIAYDWLYDDLTVTQREKIKKAVSEKAFNILLRYYPNNGIGWMAGYNNWSFVCNGGFALTALTFCSESDMRQSCQSILGYALDRNKKAIDCLGDDGAWFEGPGYWAYAMKFLAMEMAAFETAAGSTYGYIDTEGFRNTGMFVVNMSGYRTMFNFNDCSAEPCDAVCMFYFANKYKNKTIYDFRSNQLNKGWSKPTVYDMVFCRDSSDYAEVNSGDFVYQRQGIDKAGFKSAGDALTFAAVTEDNPLQSAVVLHGGINNVNHGHIDAGSFMYESMGVRWAIDTGAANYNLYNCTASDNTEKSRWSYYKMRGESHNTVIINPGLLADQNLTEEAKIVRFESADTTGIAVVDMSKVLEVPSAIRGIKLDKTTGGLLVQDEITLDKESDVYWFMATDSDVESVSEDGRTVVLKEGHKRLCVRSLSSSVKFEAMVPTRLLPISPNPDLWEENINSDNPANPKLQQLYGNKLCVKLSGVTGNIRIPVYMSPIKRPSSIYPEERFPTVTSISKWK